MNRKTVALSTSFILLFVFFFAGVPIIETTPVFAAAENDSVAVNEADPLVNVTEENTTLSLYAKLGLEEKGLARQTFERALNGYTQLNSKGFVKNPVLSIVDMSQPSCKKRLYIVDMEKEQLLVHTLVAHGKNSGNAMASTFSNTPESLQSSLGFYITGGTYQGSNGYSMRLKGMERGFNDQAENRAIVMHGAAYVNQKMAKSVGRIGRSWGCPAVSVEEHQKIINLVKNGSCLFVSAPQPEYLAQSKLAGGSLASAL